MNSKLRNAFAPDLTDPRGSSAATSSGKGQPLGTTRNRSELFFKYRRQARGATAPLMSAPGTSTTSTDLQTAKLMASALGGFSDEETGISATATSLPPQYVEFKNEIRMDMASIKDRMAELRSLHSKASLNKFDDARDDEIAVEISTQHITKLFRRCENKLQAFGRETSTSSTADIKVQRNVQRTLAVELQRLSLIFRKQQKQFLERLRARDGSSQPFSASGGGDGGSSRFSLLDNDASSSSNAAGMGSIAYDSGFSQRQSQKADNLKQVIHERDQEVIKIVSSINELAQIMKDLSVLVIDQGTVLDRIDYNIEQTASAVDQGVRQLKRAERAQRRGIAASCVMILVVAVVVMLIIVLIKAMLSFP